MFIIWELMPACGCFSSVFTTTHVRSETHSCLSQSEASRSSVRNEVINSPDGVWAIFSSLRQELIIISQKRGRVVRTVRRTTHLRSVLPLVSTLGGSSKSACCSLSFKNSFAWLIIWNWQRAYSIFSSSNLDFVCSVWSNLVVGNRDCWVWCRCVQSLEVLLLEQKIFNRFDSSYCLKICFLSYLFQVK